jgi:arginine decarboxylase
MDQQRAPLFEKLQSFHTKNTASFHVPGHKFGQDLEPMEELFLGQVMQIDYTEITGLDDLHQPGGVIKDAQLLAAACFKADHTYFLVNGSTAGNLAMILAVCQREDILIVERNVHKSVLHGLMLAGAKAVFLPPCIDEDSGLAAGVSPADIESALTAYPQAKAVLLTNPNYYGIGTALRPIAKLVHSYSIPLLVDEAHGAHYGFHSELPESALACGADGVVQSTHKMLTALTMGAMLHVQGSLLDTDIVQQCLSMLQTSSPSYPIMASLDLSRRLMAVHGTEKIANGLEAVKWFRQEMKEMTSFAIVQKPLMDHTSMDPFKIAIFDRTGTLSGYHLKQELEERGCMIEMADPKHAVLFFSLSSTRGDSERLIAAFRRISEQFGLKKKELQRVITNINTIPRLTTISSPTTLNLPHSISNQSTGIAAKTVRIKDSVGCRSAEMVIPYPPGIPLLYPGETITGEIVECLQQYIALGALFQGAKAIHLDQIQVYNH